MGGETAAAMDEGWNLPPDVLVEILLRLRTCARRFRLVCRRWREVIDTHRTVLQSRPKTLAFVADPGGTTVSAHVVDDLSEGLSRNLWTGSTTTGNGNGQDGPDVAMIGTCNGLICLCDRSKPGEITLVNPATGETLPAPPLPSVSQPGVDGTRTMGYEAYSFTYHPTTGRYKILHVPCSCSSGTEKFDAVQVLTLGDASWRAVPTPGASCDLDNGLVRVGSTVFWITAGTKQAMIMSLDLDSERLASKPLPVQNGLVRHLVEIHGRLGVATMARTNVKNTQIWVLGDEGWSQRYSVIVNGSIWQSLTLPHFAQDKYILMRDWVHQRWTLCRHIPREKMLKPSMVIVSINERGTAVVPDISGSVMRTFSYVETTEPLSCYFQASIDSTIC